MVGPTDDDFDPHHEDDCEEVDELEEAMAAASSPAPSTAILTARFGTTRNFRQCCLRRMTAFDPLSSSPHELPCGESVP